MKKALLNEVIEIRADNPEVLSLLETFFHAFPPGDGVPSLVYTVRDSDGRFEVVESGRGTESLLYTAGTPLETVTCLEEVLYEQLPSLIRERLLIHAAVVSKNGRAVLLVGRSGSGKSTLATALLEGSRGFSYLSDEIAPVYHGPESKSYNVTPFPRPIRFKNRSPKPFTLPANQCFKLPSTGMSFFLPDGRFATSDAVVLLVLFLEEAGSNPGPSRMERGEAAFLLSGYAINSPEYLVNGGISFIARMAQEVPAYRFIWSDSFRAASEIERLLSEQQ